MSLPRADWIFLGEGTYNKAYLSKDKQRVLKVLKDAREETDDPYRSERIWNEINYGVTPRAAIVYVTPPGKRTPRVAWTCPFIRGTQATDDEMFAAIIDIYNHSGRIIVDAISPKNFIKTGPPDSKVVCVDIGMALRMENEEDKVVSDHRRRKSIISLAAWRNLQRDYKPYFKTGETINPKTVNVIKALLFIKSIRPDILNASFLKSDPNLVKRLAKAYDGHDHGDAKELLAKIKLPSLESTKQSCIAALKRYIESRGTITDGKFEPSWVTRNIRDTDLTIKKVKAAQALIQGINAAHSVDDIHLKISEAFSKSSERLIFSSGLRAALNSCLIVSDITGEILNQLRRDTKQDTQRRPKI